MALTAGLPALIVAGGLGIYFWLSSHDGARAPASVAISDKSIAVLPFTDMSEKHDQEYFGDGMAEEILDLLAKIPGLTVIGRTSSFQFKGKNEDLRKIGTELNAAYVLEGSVRKSGDQVRITAQLINTKTGAHEWSETYDKPIGDVLKLQDAIAAAVVRELQLTVAPGELNSRSTVKNTEAYNLVLRGRHAADRGDKDGLDEAVTLFKQALELDPTSADAAAWFARAYEAQGEFGFRAPATAFELARREAATALKLDPRSAEAHAVLGNIHIAYDWDWAAGKREFQQAISIAPGDLYAQRLEAIHSLTLGHLDDALRQSKALIAEDPFDPINFALLAVVHDHLGHVAEAEAALRRVLDIRSTFAWAHYYLGRVLLAHGDRDAALAEMQQETNDNPQKGGLAMAYYALGRKADSDAALASMVRDQAAENAFGIAEVYAFRGQLDEAMQWLERAFAQRDPSLFLVKGDPPFKSLEVDPRYKAFLRK